MQFYKFYGIIMNWSDKDKGRSATTAKTRNIYLKSIDFNRSFHKKIFFYVERIEDNILTGGILSCKYVKLHEQIKAYLSLLNISLTDICLEEITFHAACVMLRTASRNSYIHDDDEILEEFDLDRLRSRFMENLNYEEKIIEPSDKTVIYRETEKNLVKETFIPELDRIYTGKARRNAIGHPVHYMIQTDDRDTRISTYQLLLQALYANERIPSKRYYLVHFHAGKGFSRTLYDCLYKNNIGGTMIVNYLAQDEDEDYLATGERETIECLCETMKKYQNQVLTVFCLPRECVKTREIFYENLGNTSFIELKEDFVFGTAAANFLKILAKDVGIRTDKKLFAKLEHDKEYLAPELHDLFDNWYHDKLKSCIYPQYKEIISVKQETTKSVPKGCAYDELMKMVGLSEVKHVIQQALNYHKAQKMFATRGMKSDRPTMHMVFSGNPGTAKTTVARLFARIMKENHLLSKGELIEVGRSDLVGKYVGWTASMIKKKFIEAQGNVLFIDEAYSLVDDRSGSYGDEAINTIVQEMENHRDDTVVIFAGYPDKMENFLQKNPGLRSRIAFYVPFADYNTEQLCEIAELIAQKKGLRLTSEASEKLAGLFASAQKGNDFGNGRYVRNIIEKAKMAQATRLLSQKYDSITREDVTSLCAEDIVIPVASKQNQKRIGFII